MFYCNYESQFITDTVLNSCWLFLQRIVSACDVAVLCKNFYQMIGMHQLKCSLVSDSTHSYLQQHVCQCIQCHMLHAAVFLKATVKV